MSGDYGCRTCGYAPQEAELQRGTCPFCSNSRLGTQDRLVKDLETLRPGDTLEGTDRVYNYRTYKYEQQTFQVWLVVGYHPDGSLKWKVLSGRVTFRTSDRKWRTAYSKHPHNARVPLDTTDSAVHWATQNLVYGGSFRVNQVPDPSASELARERIQEVFGSLAL